MCACSECLPAVSILIASASVPGGSSHQSMLPYTLNNQYACCQVTLLGYALDTFPQGFAKGDLQNALDGLEWGAS